MGWTRPTESQTLAAIGSVSELGPSEAAAYSIDKSAFSPLPKKPRAGDWLSAHDEGGQSFKSFARRSFTCSPHGHCDTMYIIPIGDFHPERAPPLDRLLAFAAAHFGCKIKLGQHVSVKAVSENSRVGDEGQLQILTDTVRTLLCRSQPRDCFAVIGITMIDLYTIKDSEAWNYVFGEASAMDGVGVFSFARYDPSGTFLPPDGSTEGLPPMSQVDQSELLRRSCRVLTHEGSHVVGLKHCIHFKCLMNGSNHLRESDSCPLHLCPLCLRKLALGCGFDPLERYRQLAAWYAAEPGFEQQMAWTEARIATIEKAAMQAGGELCGECCPSATEVLATTLASGAARRRQGFRGGGSNSRVVLMERETGTAIQGSSQQTSLPAGKKQCPLFTCRGKRGCLCKGMSTGKGLARY